MEAVLDAPARDLVGALRDHATESGVPSDALARHLYDDLRQLARRHRARWSGHETMNTTAIVHEAYLKLASSGGFEDGRHFLSVASRAMRHVLVSYARERGALKRGGTGRDVRLDDAPSSALLSHEQATDVVGLDAALDRFAALDPRAARVVELRTFGELTIDEVAAELAISEATVTRDWRRARAWLRAELGELAPFHSGRPDPE